MSEGASSRERELSAQLEAAQAITHIGSWEWTVATGTVTWSDELFRIYGYEPRSVDVTLELFLSRIAPEERERIQRDIEAVLKHPGRFAYREVIVRPDGSRRTLDTIGEALTDDHGAVTRVLGTCRDITDVVHRDERLRFYADVFEHALVGLSSWARDVDGKLRLVAFNLALEKLIDIRLGEKLGAPIAEILPVLAPRLAAGESGVIGPYRRIGINGSPFFRATVFPLPSEHLGIAIEDVTERVFTDAIAANERRCLEMLAAGTPLLDVLTSIAQSIEDTVVGTLGSIVLLDETGTRIGQAIGPSLPPEYNAALIGLQIGAHAGSCGTAMYRREVVITDDIANDSLWSAYKQLVPYGIKSCWSHPIIGSDGRVLGSFALYHRESRKPSPRGIEAAKRVAHVTAMVIERRMLDEEMRALAARIEAAREQERTAIARDIHDQLGQALTALRLDVGWLQRRLEDETIRRKLEDMAVTTDDVLRTVRRISADLRPGVLDTLGLSAAIEWQAEEYQRRTGTECKVTENVTDLQLDRDLSTNVFRIFQEALTNISRHAAATHVEVAVRLDRGRLLLEISDDGIGMPEIAPRGSSLGILGMRERARRLGGECTVRRRWPRGTIVSVSVPLRFPAERASG